MKKRYTNVRKRTKIHQILRKKVYCNEARASKRYTFLMPNLEIMRVFIINSLLGSAGKILVEVI